jgi:hypothetical protein
MQAFFCLIFLFNLVQLRNVNIQWIGMDFSGVTNHWLEIIIMLMMEIGGD